MGGPGHTAMLRTLYEIGHVITHADPICEHFRWADEYHFFVSNMVNFWGFDKLRFNDQEEAEQVRRISTFSLPLTALDTETWTTTPLNLENAFMHKKLKCALFREVDCLCPDRTVFGTLYVNTCTYLFFSCSNRIAPAHMLTDRP